MPRYDDRYSNTRLYVGRLSSRTRSRDLESVFSRYGRVRDVDMKYDYAFVEFSDARDADDAQYSLNGRDVDGSRIIVEFAKGIPRASGSSSREYLGRGPPPGTGRCFNCGIDGHWARDCKAGDWKNKCYRCGDRGHIERNCQNSPKKLKKDRNYSRSPVRRSRSPRRGRSRSPSHERGRSYSRSRSPPKRERVAEEKKRLRSYSRSPTPKDLSPPPPSKTRKVVRSHSRSPSRSPRDEISPSNNGGHDRSEYGESPRGKSRSRSPSPSPVKRDVSLPPSERYESPSEANGRGRRRSPSPKDESRSPSPIYEEEEEEEDDPRSPKGSKSP